MQIPDEILNTLLPLAKPLKQNKSDFLLSEGEICRNLYFVKSGLIKSCKLENGKEHVIAFAYPGEFCSVPDSYLTADPSPVFLECISETELLSWSKEQLDEAVRENHLLREYWDKSVIQLLVGSIQRVYELQCLSMDDRFLRFYSRSKHLLNLIPRKDIASYLRIDPSNLSKLLRKYSMQDMV